jgi:hypothetical protein
MVGYTWLTLVGDCVFGEWFAYNWWHSVGTSLRILSEVFGEISEEYRWIIKTLKAGLSEVEGVE